MPLRHCVHLGDSYLKCALCAYIERFSSWDLHDFQLGKVDLCQIVCVECTHYRKQRFFWSDEKDETEFSRIHSSHFIYQNYCGSVKANSLLNHQKLELYCDPYKVFYCARFISIYIVNGIEVRTFCSFISKCFRSAIPQYLNFVLSHFVYKTRSCQLRQSNYCAVNSYKRFLNLLYWYYA